MNESEIQTRLDEGATLIDDCDYAGAVEKYLSILRSDKSSGRAHNGLGCAYMNMDQWMKATKAFHDAEKLLPDHPAIQSNLGICYNERGFESQALQYSKRAVTLDGENPDYLHSVGVTCLDFGLFEEAVEAFKKAIRLDPTNVERYIAFGRIHSGLGRGVWMSMHQEAIDQFEVALSLDPENSKAEIFLEQAREQLSRSAPPNLAEIREGALSCKAYLLAKNGTDSLEREDWESAIEQYQQSAMLASAVGEEENAAAARRGEAKAHLQLGRAREAAGDTDGAIQAYLQAVELNPKSDASWHNLGMSYHARGEHEKAVDALTRAASLDPKCIGSHLLLAQSHYALGHKIETMAACEAAMRAGCEAADSAEEMFEAIAYDLEESLAEQIRQGFRSLPTTVLPQRLTKRQRVSQMAAQLQGRLDEASEAEKSAFVSLSEEVLVDEMVEKAEREAEIAASQHKQREDEERTQREVELKNAAERQHLAKQGLCYVCRAPLGIVGKLSKRLVHKTCEGNTRMK